jgi:hypothetical protein
MNPHNWNAELNDLHVVIFAHPRCGSTSLLDILNVHPDINIIVEEPFHESFSIWRRNEKNYADQELGDATRLSYEYTREKVAVYFHSLQRRLTGHDAQVVHTRCSLPMTGVKCLLTDQAIRGEAMKQWGIVCQTAPRCCYLGETSKRPFTLPCKMSATAPGRSSRAIT